MDATFDHARLGTYRLRGAEPIDLLWDLFDQMVAAEVPYASRLGWEQSHRHYIGRRLGGGRVIVPLSIPQPCFFELHCTLMLAAIEAGGAAPYPFEHPDPSLVLNWLVSQRVIADGDWVHGRQP